MLSQALEVNILLWMVEVHAMVQNLIQTLCSKYFYYQISWKFQWHRTQIAQKLQLLAVGVQQIVVEINCVCQLHIICTWVCQCEIWSQVCVIIWVNKNVLLFKCPCKKSEYFHNGFFFWNLLFRFQELNVFIPRIWSTGILNQKISLLDVNPQAKRKQFTL